MIELEKDEHIIYEIRRHPLVFITEVSIIVLMAIAPLVGLIILNNFQIQISFIRNIGSIFTFFYGLWLLILWVIGVIFWTSYYLDVWVVTSKKIIDIEQDGLFKRRVAFLHLDKIQDVTVRINGLMPTILNYGNILVQTAAMQGEFVIKGIPNPKYLHKKINEAIKHYKDELRKYN